MNRTLKAAGILLVVFAGLLIAILIFASTRSPEGEIWSLSAVAEAAQEGRIERIVVWDDNELHATLDDGRTVIAGKDPSGTAWEQLAALGVSTEQLTQIEWGGRMTSRYQTILTAILYILPLVIVVLVIVGMVQLAI